MAIKRALRVVDKKGHEYLRIIQSGQIVELPWNSETVATLKAHFTEETEFQVRDEAKWRTYQGPREWWEKLSSSEFIKCSKQGVWPL